MKAIATIDEAGRLTRAGLAGSVPWWSFTKTVLAAAALRLVEAGALDLDAGQPGAAYTLRQLLRHEAGLPDYGELPAYHAAVAAGERPWPAAHLLAATDAERPRYQPGRGWRYSNIGYLKIGACIERATGQELGEALARLVLIPCGATTTRLTRRAEDLASVQMGTAASYDPGWVYHGLLAGPVAEAAQVLHRLTRGLLLTPEMLAAMRSGRGLPAHRSVAHPDPAYGLGLMLAATAPLDHPMGHSGAGPGSRIAVYALGGRTVALWAAASSGCDPEAAAIRRLRRRAANR